MDTEEIQQIQILNLLSDQNNVKVISCSSELQNAQAINLISPSRKIKFNKVYQQQQKCNLNTIVISEMQLILMNWFKTKIKQNIWMSEEGMPQHVVIDISKLKDRPKFIKCVAFDCWHDYKTNPSIIEFLVSTNNIKEYITWSTFYLEQIVIKETFGASKTYLNQMLLFEEFPYANKQTQQNESQQQLHQANNQNHLTRNKINAQELSMNMDSEADDKYYNGVGRLNIPKQYPTSHISNTNNTMNTQSNLITQTNNTLPDQSSNMISPPHPANLPSINYPMLNTQERRPQGYKGNSIEKKSLASSPSEDLLLFQGHQQNNTLGIGMNGQFFHTPSQSNQSLVIHNHLQSNQVAPLDSLQKQLYNIQLSTNYVNSSLKGLKNIQQLQGQLNDNQNIQDNDNVQQNLSYKLQNMTKDSHQIHDHFPQEMVIDNSHLTPMQDNYSELHKHLFGQPSPISQQKLRDNNQSNNNIFDKINIPGYNQINQDGVQKANQKTNYNNNYHPNNTNYNTNINNNQHDDRISQNLLTHSEKEVLALKRQVQELKEEVQSKDNQIKKLEQIIYNLQYTTQNLVSKIESLENKFENFKSQNKNQISYRRNTTQPDENVDDSHSNICVLETNQKNAFPLNSPQTFGKNLSQPQHKNYVSDQKFDEQNNSYNNQVYYERNEPQSEADKINQIIEQKLYQFQKVIVSTLKKNFVPNQEQQNTQPLKLSQNIQNKQRENTHPTQDNYDTNKQYTNNSRNNSANSHSYKGQENFQPPTFNSNQRRDTSSYIKNSYNQSGMDSHTNQYGGNRSYSNHSQYASKNNRINFHQNQDQNKYCNTEQSRISTRPESHSNPRVVKLLEKLQQKLTIRIQHKVIFKNQQKKVEQLNSGIKNKRDYYQERDIEEYDNQQRTSPRYQSRLFY